MEFEVIKHRIKTALKFGTLSDLKESWACRAEKLYEDSCINRAFSSFATMERNKKGHCLIKLTSFVIYLFSLLFSYATLFLIVNE